MLICHVVCFMGYDRTNLALSPASAGLGRLLCSFLGLTPQALCCRLLRRLAPSCCSHILRHTHSSSMRTRELKLNANSRKDLTTLTKCKVVAIYLLGTLEMAEGVAL